MMTEQKHKEAIKRQRDDIFALIENAAGNQQYSVRYTSHPRYNYELYPEVQSVLRTYGYGVVCPDDGGKCWEISWDSNSNGKVPNSRKRFLS